MKKPVGDIGETCAGRVQRSVPRLVVREKLVLLEVSVNHCMDGTLEYLGEHREGGNWSIVGCVSG